MHSATPLLAFMLAATPLFAEIAPQPSAGCAAASIERGRRLMRAIDVDGTKRGYVLDVPDSVHAGTPVPLLLDFHGFGHSGAGVWQVSEFGAIAEKAGVIVVYPEGLPVRLTLHGIEREAPGWQMFTVDGNRDVAFVGRLLDDLERRYCIDRARIFATGFSNGAFFTSLLGCTMADRLAAVAPVAGGPLRVPCSPSRGVPVLIQHGRQDDLLPLAYGHASRDGWARTNHCAGAGTPSDGAACQRWTECRDGATVEYCEGDYAHRWPPGATERVWAFFETYPHTSIHHQDTKTPRGPGPKPRP